MVNGIILEDEITVLTMENIGGATSKDPVLSLVLKDILLGKTT